MNSCGCVLEVQDNDADDLEWSWLPVYPSHPTLPSMLQPVGKKVRVHDDIRIVLGISRISSRKNTLDYSNKLHKCHDRAQEYI